MTDAVTVSLIAAVASFLSTLVGVLNNMLSRQQHAETKEGMDDLQKNTNGLSAALVKAKAEYKRGVEQGREAAKEETEE